MLTAFGRAFRTPDLRKKLLFTLGIIVLYRLGSHIPTPGVSYTAIQKCMKNAPNTGFLGLANLFSGGALLQLSIFALGIMPYITASIIVVAGRSITDPFMEPPLFPWPRPGAGTRHAAMPQHARYRRAWHLMPKADRTIKTGISRRARSRP